MVDAAVCAPAAHPGKDRDVVFLEERPDGR